MIVSARTRANRRNALLSTGPRTPGGKMRSAMNARIHGFSARPIVNSEEAAELIGKVVGTADSVAAREAAGDLAEAMIMLSRIRRERERLVGLLQDAPTRETCNVLSRLLRLERYDRAARARSSKAARYLDGVKPTVAHDEQSKT